MFYFYHRPSIYIFSIINFTNPHHLIYPNLFIQNSFPSLIYGIVVILFVSLASINFSNQNRIIFLTSFYVILFSEIIQLLFSKIMKFDYKDIFASILGLIFGYYLIRVLQFIDKIKH